MYKRQQTVRTDSPYGTDDPYGRSVRTVRTDGPYGRSVRTVRTDGPYGRSVRTVRTDGPYGRSVRTVRTDGPYGPSVRTVWQKAKSKNCELANREPRIMRNSSSFQVGANTIRERCQKLEVTDREPRIRKKKCAGFLVKGPETASRCYSYTQSHMAPSRLYRYTYEN